ARRDRRAVRDPGGRADRGEPGEAHLRAIAPLRASGRGSPPRGAARQRGLLRKSVIRARNEAAGVSGLDPAAPRGAVAVDGAADAVSERAFQRGAPLFLADQLQVPLAALVGDGVAIDDTQPAQQARARLDEHVVAVSLGAVLPRVAAAGSASLAIERHAADVAGPGSCAQAVSRGGRTARSAMRPSVRTVRAPGSSMRRARAAAPSRSAPLPRKSNCAACAEAPNRTVRSGKAWTSAPPAIEA